MSKSKGISRSYLVLLSNSFVSEFSLHMSAAQTKLFYFLVGAVSREDEMLCDVDIDFLTLYRILSLDYQHCRAKQYTQRFLESAAKSKIVCLLDSAQCEERERAWMRILYISGKKENATVRIRLEPWLAQYLVGVKRSFTAFQYSDISGMSGVAALKLCPIMLFLSKYATVELPLDDITELLSLNREYYSYQTIHHRVLEPAFREIAENTGLIVTTQPVRSETDKRIIKSIVFSFKQEKPPKHAPPRITIQDEWCRDDSSPDGFIAVRRIRAAEQEV